MTTISTAADHPIAAPTVNGAARFVAVIAAAAGLVLATTSLTDEVLPAGAWVRAAVVATWAFAGAVLALRGHERLGVVVGAASAVGGLCAVTATSSDLGEVHAVAAALVPALALHIELLLPDGEIGRPARRNLAIAGYAIAGLTGLAMAATSAAWLGQSTSTWSAATTRATSTITATAQPTSCSRWRASPVERW